MTENLVQIILILQSFACIWYGIACPGNICSNDSWVAERNNADHNKVLTLQHTYVDSVYWALATMTSTGYGDIHATNNIEKLFASFVMVIGKLVFGFVLGNVASTMANVEALRVKFEERFSAVQAHMKDQNMPINLQQRVVNFFQYIWRRNHGSSNNGLFSNLPPCLHGELCLELTGELMQKVPLFKKCELSFIRQLCTKTQLVQFHEDEFITRKGDIGHEMYFIKKGEVEVIGDGGEKRILRDGDYFGDESLVTNLPRKNITHARTHVDMFCLHHQDLESAFQSYAEEAVKVKANSSQL